MNETGQLTLVLFSYWTPPATSQPISAASRPSGKDHHIGVSEWTADEIRSAASLATELKIDLVSNQLQYNMLWRVIDQDILHASEELGISQIAWSPLA